MKKQLLSFVFVFALGTFFAGSAHALWCSEIPDCSCEEGVSACGEWHGCYVGANGNPWSTTCIPLDEGEFTCGGFPVAVCGNMTDGLPLTDCGGDLGYFCSTIDVRKVEHRTGACTDCVGCTYNTSFNMCDADQECVETGEGTAECQTMASISSVAVSSGHGGNTIRWTTGAERNNLGFNIYVVTSAGKIVKKVNDRLVLGAMTTPIGEHYELLDSSGKPGDLYKLESVDIRGNLSETDSVKAIPHIPAPLKKRFDPTRIRMESRRVRRAVEAARRTPSEWFRLQAGPDKVQPRLFPGTETLGVSIRVKEAGLYRITVAELAETGLDLVDVPTGDVSLSLGGVDVPFSTTALGGFSRTDTIEFYGRENNGPHSAINTYFLSVSSGKGLEIARVSASPVNDRPYAPHYDAVVRFEENKEYALTSNLDDLFYWGYLFPQHTEETYVFQIDNIASGADSFRFKAELDGVTDNRDVNPDHHYMLYLNDKLVSDVTWDGQEMFSINETLPMGRLKEGENTVRVKYLATDSPYDLVGVDGFTIEFARAFVAENDRLVFDYFGEDNIEIKGFSTADLAAFDITDPGHPARLEDIEIVPDNDSYSVRFFKPGEGTSRYLVQRVDGLFVPQEIEARHPSDIKSQENGADLLIVTYDAFAPALEPLVALRRKQGMRVAVVTTEEIYDEFNFGNVNDQAIKDFIVYTTKNWKQPAPKHVLLVGDTTNDPKDYLDLGIINFAPSHHIETSLWGGTTTDQWYADLDDSTSYDIGIGRLSVTTPGETENLVRKIVAYEQASGNTRGMTRVILMAGQSRNPTDDFETKMDAIAEEIPDDYEVVKIYSRDYETEDDAKVALMAELSRGSMLVIFMGHGSGLSWSNMLSTDDIENLPEGVHLPLMVGLSCVNGYFSYPGLDIMGEAFVKPPNSGAIATWMPADLGLGSLHQALAMGFVKQLFGGRTNVIGEDIKSALNEFVVTHGSKSPAALDIANTLVFMGDPTISLPIVSRDNDYDDGNGDNVVDDLVDCACNVTGAGGKSMTVLLLLGVLFFLWRRTGSNP